MGLLNLATAFFAPRPLRNARFSSSCTLLAETTGAPGGGGSTPPPEESRRSGTDRVPVLRKQETN